MSAPGRESKLNRIHLIVTICTSLLAAALGIFGIVNQNQAQNLTVDVEGLSDELSEVESERDALAEEADETPTEEVTGGAEYLELSEAVGTDGCQNYGFGEWTAGRIELTGTEYLNGFSCTPWLTDTSEQPVGYVDFLVPADVERVTGIAGIDDRSADTTMTTEFVVHSVPKGDAPLFSKVLVFGDTAELDVGVVGLNRVRFQVRVIATEYQLNESPAHLSWADMKFE